MHIEIIDKPIHLNLHGFSGTAINQDYAGTAFQLSNRMWQTVQANSLKNKGQNIWIYEAQEKVFAGVELTGVPEPQTALEQKFVTLTKYAYYKHIGPYNLIRQAGQNMRAELKRQGLEPVFPYIEMYGHWTNDETKLETELFMSLG